MKVNVSDGGHGNHSACTTLVFSLGSYIKQVTLAGHEEVLLASQTFTLILICP